MDRKPADPATVDKFLEELAETLDIRKTTIKLGLSEEDARSILLGLRKKKKTGAVRDLFAEPVASAHRAPSKCVANIDGASRGNPGKAGAGALIKDPEGRVLKALKKYLGTTTNNIAEYSALLVALKGAVDLGCREIEVLADSELLVKQINGIYKVRSEDIRPLYEEAVALLKGFKSYKVRHIYREQNSAADALANEAIDSAR